MALLRRLGRKTQILPELLDLFPEQVTTFIDLFFGTGSVSFAILDRVKKVIANDNDWNVINLFLVMKDRKEELLQAVQSMPEHGALMDYWKTHQEVDPVWQACRFLMLSNFVFLGKKTMHYEAYGKGLAKHNKGKLLKTIQNGEQERIASPKISYMCKDFRKVLSSICFQKNHFGRPVDAKGQSFVYADPPYCQTGHNYKSGFTEQDTRDLFEICINSGIRFAISEFETPFVLGLVEEYNLHISQVKGRRTLKSRNIEVLITNYEPQRQQLSLY